MWSARQQSMLNAMGYALYERPRRAGAAVQPVLVAGESAPSSPSANSPDPALFIAVMKAARGKDVSRLGIDFDALRGSPSAKRALWSHLRRVIKS